MAHGTLVPNLGYFSGRYEQHFNDASPYYPNGYSYYYQYDSGRQDCYVLFTAVQDNTYIVAFGEMGLTGTLDFLIYNKVTAPFRYYTLVKDDYETDGVWRYYKTDASPIESYYDNKVINDNAHPPRTIATTGLYVYDSLERALVGEGLVPGGDTYPITYRLTNCTANSAPTEAAVGDTVNVPLTFPSGYGIANASDAYVMNNGVLVPSSYSNGVLTFEMPDPS